LARPRSGGPHREGEVVSRRTGFLVLLAGSEILGIAVGEWFFRFFLQTVPPLALSSFNSGAAHIGFLGYGALTGLVFFAWSLLVMLMQGIQRRIGDSDERRSPGA
jgi:hypothetical protein